MIAAMDRSRSAAWIGPAAIWSRSTDTHRFRFATGGKERTPWRATQLVAWEALDRANRS